MASLRLEGFVEPWELPVNRAIPFEFRRSETREGAYQPNVKRGQDLRPALALRPEGFVEPRQREALLGVCCRKLREILASRGVEKGQGQSPTLSLRPEGFEPSASGLEGRCSVL